MYFGLFDVLENVEDLFCRHCQKKKTCKAPYMNDKRCVHYNDYLKMEDILETADSKLQDIFSDNDLIEALDE